MRWLMRICLQMCTGRKEGSGLRHCSLEITDLLLVLPSWLCEIPWTAFGWKLVFLCCLFFVEELWCLYYFKCCSLLRGEPHAVTITLSLFCAPKPELSALCGWVRNKVECKESKQCMLCVCSQNTALPGSFCSVNGHSHLWILSRTGCICGRSATLKENNSLAFE